MTISLSEYNGLTASMQVDPEAPLTEAVSESFLRAFPVEEARCGDTHSDMDWVPDREQSVVPVAMRLTCAGCPVRQQCLQWATRCDEPGYWAGTTKADREQMASLAQTSIETADWLQSFAATAEAGDPIGHEVGQGSYRHYRRDKCRCGECRQANSGRRAAERDKVRSAAQRAA